jgi:UDP-N-acetylglucosamine acyltransferase
MNIHPLACVDPTANLADDVTVGPWTLIGPEVCIGAGTIVGAHTVITGKTTIGINNKIASFVALGSTPQHATDKGKDTCVVIGDNNHIFEQVTVSRGTGKEGETSIGNRCMLMVGAHVAHDCTLEDQVTMVNHATMAGHVIVKTGATLGAFSLIHQHCTIGAYSFLSRACAAPLDVMPYTIVVNNPAEVRGVNKVALRRAGYTRQVISVIEAAYKLLFRNAHYQHEEVKERLEVMVADNLELQPMLDLLTTTSRGYTR